jgi:hypothetical protein
MNAKTLAADFHETLNVWRDAVDKYTPQQFAKQPAEDSWSIGQVCAHLIGSTERIFAAIRLCLRSADNANMPKTDAGEKAFKTQILSETKVRAPRASVQFPESPDSRTVHTSLDRLEKEFIELSGRVEMADSTGKQKHPVLGYLTAEEWLKSIDMHFRHHLKQKADIDQFLNSEVI